MAVNIKKNIFERRGRRTKIYKLDRGKIKVTVKQVMEITGCKESAARYRLAHSKQSKKVLAPKGQHQDFGYGKQKILAKQVENDYNDQSDIKKRLRLKIDHIKKTHPFYDKGEKGKLHRIAFGKW